MSDYIYIAIAIGLILVALYLLMKVKKIRVKAYELFLKAEHEFNNGDNKMDYVIDNLYPYVPPTIKLFISQAMFKKIVQKMFDEIKDLLDDGKLNSSTKGSN